ncbi:MAG: class I SAM-dependent methyltransferase [Quadrisphaera sp.]
MSAYTHGHAEPVLASHRWRTAENSCGYLLPALRPGQDLLDLGCGPGTITADLAARVAPGRVVGLDAAAGVLEEAAALAERRGLAVEWVVGDALALPFEDASFDVVHAHQVLQHLPDPVGALREAARVLRPGGLLAVRDVDYAATTWYPGRPGPGRLAVAVPAGRSRQRRRARRRAPPPRVGARRRPGGAARPAPCRGHRQRLRVVLRLTRGAQVVGDVVGGPGDRLGLRRAGRGRWRGDPGAAGGRRRRVAPLGRRGRRLDRPAPRRAARADALSHPSRVQLEAPLLADE